jgi:hypothetical protein
MIDYKQLGVDFLSKSLAPPFDCATALRFADSQVVQFNIWDGSAHGIWSLNVDLSKVTETNGIQAELFREMQRHGLEHIQGSFPGVC